MEDKRSKILQSALRVFAEKGFYNSKVSEIAKEAEIANGTVYLYFRNKNDILISLLEGEFGRMISNMREEVERESNPLEKIKIFASIHLNMITKNRYLSELIQVEVRQSAKFLGNHIGYVNKRFVEYLNIVASIIKEGQRQGVIREDVTPGIVKRAFFGALDEMARYWILSPTKKHTITDSAKEISEIFIRGIIQNP